METDLQSDNEHTTDEDDSYIPDQSPSHASSWIDLCEDITEDEIKYLTNPEQYLSDHITQSEYSESIKSTSIQSTPDTYDYSDSFIDDSSQHEKKELPMIWIESGPTHTRRPTIRKTSKPRCKPKHKK